MNKTNIQSNRRSTNSKLNYKMRNKTLKYNQRNTSRIIRQKSSQQRREFKATRTKLKNERLANADKQATIRAVGTAVAQNIATGGASASAGIASTNLTKQQNLINNGIYQVETPGATEDQNPKGTGEVPGSIPSSGGGRTGEFK